MGQKLRQAPVFFAVAQVQHNPLLSLESFLPRIQESMRQSGYPDFRRGVQMRFALSASLAQGAQTSIPPVQSEHYLFLNSAATSGFALLTNALAYQTTEYDTFDAFVREFRRGLEILQAAVGGLSFVERLGLRYLDAVVPREGESIGQYLAQEVLGLPARLTEQKFSYAFAESLLVEPGVGQVVARTIIQNAPLAFPPDLIQHQLSVSQRFRDVTGEHAVIDTDASITERKDFDLDQVEKGFKGLHGLVDATFQATATDHARLVWNEQRGA
jgi:uncharacterized protein (TIGR04255 family)